MQSCWVAGDKKPYAGAIGDLLGEPADHKLIALVAMGYGAGPGEPTPRRPLSDLLHCERF